MNKRRHYCPIVRLVRVGRAHEYFGLSRNLFNKLIRPCLTVIELSKQVKVVDIEEMAALADRIKQALGRAPIAEAFTWLEREVSGPFARDWEPDASTEEPESSEQESSLGQTKDA